MKAIFLILCMIYLFTPARSQGKYLTNNGTIKFYSHTVIEDITAENRRVAAVVDAEKGEVAVIVMMREFQFEFCGIRKISQSLF